MGSMLALALPAVDCGSETRIPTPLATHTPINLEVLQLLVQGAASQARPQGSGNPALTEEQPPALVQSAEKDSMSPELTAANGAELVQAALKSAMSCGITPQQAEEAIAAPPARTRLEEETTKEWLESVQANNAAIYPNNTPQVAAVSAEEMYVVPVNHYYLLRVPAEEVGIFATRDYHLRSGGHGATMMVAGAGVVSPSDNRNASKTFLEFMLSPDGQQ